MWSLGVSRLCCRGPCVAAPCYLILPPSRPPRRRYTLPTTSPLGLLPLSLPAIEHARASHTRILQHPTTVPSRTERPIPCFSHPRRFALGTRASERALQHRRLDTPYSGVTHALPPLYPAPTCCRGPCATVSHSFVLLPSCRPRRWYASRAPLSPLAPLAPFLPRIASMQLYHTCKSACCSNRRRCSCPMRAYLPSNPSAPILP